ncbi:MAG: ChrR family anti-sigma-E factor [Pseudomonadota bacterium]
MTLAQNQHPASAVTSTGELLTAYAAGTTSPGLSLLCAAHLTLRPEGRRFVQMVEEVGGELLEAEDESSVAPMDFAALLARLDEGAPEPRGREAGVAGDGPLPQPILRAAGLGFDQIPWRKRLGGVADYQLDGFEGEKVGLLRARPGARIPKHTHKGLEATLVLQGVLRDGGEDHRFGDIALAGPEDDHIPEIVGDETCYCLVVIDGALRFTGTFGRALNLFAE